MYPQAEDGCPLANRGRKFQYSLFRVLTDCRILNFTRLALPGFRTPVGFSHRGLFLRGLLVLERLYMIFRIHPFGAPPVRATRKEAKHYHFDWTVLDDEANGLVL